MPHDRFTRVAYTFSIPPNFGCLGRRVSFSTATGDSASLRLCFALFEGQ
jgi:hypothetical protein